MSLVKYSFDTASNNTFILIFFGSQPSLANLPKRKTRYRACKYNNIYEYIYVFLFQFVYYDYKLGSVPSI